MSEVEKGKNNVLAVKTVLYYKDDNGDFVRAKNIAGAARVTTVPGGISVTPTEENILASAPTGAILLNDTAGDETAGFAFVVDPTDYAEFRTNLLAGYVDTQIFRTDSEIIVYPAAGSSYITNVFGVGFGTTTNTGGYVINSTVSTVSTANIDAAHLQFTFLVADKIKAVVMKLSGMGVEFDDTATQTYGFSSNQKALLSIQGYK